MEMRYQVVTVHWPLDALICAANNVWGEMALLPNTDSTALILPRLTDLTLISSVFLCHKCVRYYYTTNKIYFLNANGCFQKPCLLFRKYKSQVDIAFFFSSCSSLSHKNKWEQLPFIYRHAQYNTEVNFGPGWVSRARTQQPQCWHKSSQSGLIYQDQEPLKIRGY